MDKQKQDTNAEEIEIQARNTNFVMVSFAYREFLTFAKTFSIHHHTKVKLCYYIR